ncbi:MAG: TIGR04086 family membrane protein [Oscillospiraceae bacterium]|nr:TIGR04086 family membrane protein [Oscillospiraceae bacterium]
MSGTHKMKQNAVGSKYVFWALLTAVCGVFTVLVLFTILSFIIASVDIPLYWITPLSTGAGCLAAFVSGIVLARMIGEHGMLGGFLAGLGLFALLFVASLISGQRDFTQLTVIKLIAFSCSGALGGILGINLYEKAKTRH